MHEQDFIEVFPHALGAEFCNHLVHKFDTSNDALPGVMGQGVDATKKDSLDLNITSHPSWQQESREIINHTIRGLVPYVRRYPFLLTGTTSFEWNDPQSGQRRTITHEDITGMSDPQIAELFLKVFRLGSINLQKYQKGKGGYHQWHSEVFPSPTDPQCEQMHRVLLWMIYLNDVDEGGETAFFHQGRKIAPRRGSLVVAPTSFTHTHKGHVPSSGDKYILTSWVLYQRAQDMFG